MQAPSQAGLYSRITRAPICTQLWILGMPLLQRKELFIPKTARSFQVGQDLAGVYPVLKVMLNFGLRQC